MVSPSTRTMPNLGSYGSLYATQKTNQSPAANPNTGAADQQQTTTPPNQGLAGAAGGSDSKAALTQILSMLATILTALIAQMQGGQPSFDQERAKSAKSAKRAGISGGGGGVASPAGLGNSGGLTPTGTAPASAGQLATSAQQTNMTQNPAQKQRLDTTLSKVAKDPDGAKLLQAALAKGYTIEVGDPTQAGSQDAGPKDADSVNGVTIPDQKKIIINPNAPNFDKTVVHELVHAATEVDGNSKTEEGMADVIGFRVSSRMNGIAEPGSEQQIFQNKIASYPDLNNSNDILNSLSRLGIQA
jgi:hypothetical protein